MANYNPRSTVKFTLALDLSSVLSSRSDNATSSAEAAAAATRRDVALLSGIWGEGSLPGLDALETGKARHEAGLHQLRFRFDSQRGTLQISGMADKLKYSQVGLRGDLISFSEKNTVARFSALFHCALSPTY